jgi:hypothetical protein
MKRALLVGINYVGTGNDLKGCINDSNNMKAMLGTYGFEDIKMVLEAEATTAGIKAGLEWLVADTKPGDVIVFHYSGHGSQLPSKAEPDGFEEIICPIDLNWRDKVITDDTLKTIFDKVPNGVNVTVILDCCHSGTMLDQNESLAIETKSLDGIPFPTTEKVRAKELRAKDGLTRYLPPPAAILEQLENSELVEWSTAKDVNATALLVAMCKADQTSADAQINGVFQGAGTASLLKSIAANPKISYKALVHEMTDFMVANRYSQRPQLDGSFGLYNEEFLAPWTMFVNEANPVSVEPVAQSVDTIFEDGPDEDEKKDKSPIMVIAAIIIAIILFVIL